ncbi:MAG: DUF58 domain-containing protein [Phycisphaeraceae bacterium]
MSSSKLNPTSGDPAWLTPENLAGLGTVELRARLLIEGLSVGQHRSPLRGLSLEFAEHRPYTPGDDLRHLDWKAYGKSDRLYLKRHHQETNVDLMLLVDASGSMAYRSEGAVWSKFTGASTLAVALAMLAHQQHDRSGFATFGQDSAHELGMSSARQQWRLTARVLDQAQPSSRAPAEPSSADDLSKAVVRLGARLRRRSIVVILSDFFDDPTAIRSALARLKFAGHDVLLLQLIDPAERDFPFCRSTEFEGLEGEGRLPVEPAALRESYRRVFAEHLESLGRAAASLGFDHLTLATDEPLLPVLRECLSLRAGFASRRG